MRGNIWLICLIIVILVSVGLTFVSFSNQIREYYFRMYKQGIERTGFLTSWADKYPNPWAFKLFGLILILFASLIIATVFLKKE